MAGQSDTEQGYAPVCLYFMTAARKGSVFGLDSNGEYRFGRDPECEIHLPEPNVSRMHARMLWDSSTLNLEDLKSTNGVFVNGDRVPAALLHHGDVVAIGPCVFRVQFNAATTSSVTIMGTDSAPGPAENVSDNRAQFQNLFECMLAIQRIVSEDSGNMVEQCLETLFLALPVTRLCLLQLNSSGEMDPWFTKTISGISREFVMSKTFARKVREAGKGILIHDALHLDQNEWGHTMQQQEVRSILGVPVFDSGSMISILLCDNLESPHILRDEHVRTLEFFARALETVFQRSRMRSLEASQVATERQFLAARRVQKQIFTKRPDPVMGGMRWVLAYLPALQVGGDFYDFAEHEDGVTWVVADVTGKGISAALVVSMLKGLCKTLFPLDTTPRNMLLDLNTLLLGELPPEMFLTAAVMRTYRDGRLLCANAGHLPLIVIPRSGDMRRIKPHGVPLGFLSGDEFSGRLHEETVMLQAGDRVLSCTDGVTEAASPSGDFFGEKRLLSALTETRDTPVSDALERLIKTIREFQGVAPQHDDITVVYGECEKS